MSRRCDLNQDKGVMSGNRVSHSNRKNRRRFLPNIQVFTLRSEVLGESFEFSSTPSTIRSVEHNHGIDNYLMKTANSKLSKGALDIKKRIAKAMANQQAVS